MSISYDFAEYLAQVPQYKRKKDSDLLQRATTSADLVFDPQRSETERQRQWQEAQHINAMQGLKASQSGIDETLAYNAAQRKKANAIRAASAGAIGSSGLSDYLNAETDKALEGQRLSIAATLAANQGAERANYALADRQGLEKLSELERLRGQTKANVYENLLADEDARATDWDMNALQVALGIGSGELQGADLAFREQNAADSLSLQKYIADLPYNKMTKYQKAMEDRLTKELMGGIPGTNPNAIVGLRAYAEGQGYNVGWDAATGNVTVGNKTLTPDTLRNQYGAILDASDGRWKIPQSQMAALLR
jgi:hypothetical protein